MMETNVADAPKAVASELYDAPPLPPLPGGWNSLAGAFVASARRRGKAIAACDSTRISMSYEDLLTRSVALGRLLARKVGRAEYVGVMLPPTAHGVLANVALTLFDKISVNLNYTASDAVVASSIEQCAITHVITSRRVIDKFKITPKAELLYLEDLPKEVTTGDKLAAGAARVLPRFLLPCVLPGLRGSRLKRAATIIFTSGSTGDPKGVILTHENVLSNMLGIKTHIHLSEKDTLLGILPLFHSFGFTVNLWTVLGLGLKGVYHFSPLDGKIVANLCEEHSATVLTATPTFVRGYLQRCKPEQFSTLRLMLLGAEKLKPELAKEIKQKLGIDALEGYGCTETGPVVAVNRPFEVDLGHARVVSGNRWGTVGQLLPGTHVRTTDVDSGLELPRGVEGLIHVKGPQIMAGYLNKPEATARVLRDGWYETGDLGYLDPDGFLRITDRLSRFSKIGGEMVPHHAVENAIVLSCQLDESTFVVTSVPDPKRGERLVVVHTTLPVEPNRICKQLLSTDIPRLWIPSPDDFVHVDALPVLGTGKLDLREVRRIAQARASNDPPANPDSACSNS